MTLTTTIISALTLIAPLPQPEPPKTPAVTIRVLDQYNNAVPNAVLGTNAYRGDSEGESPDWLLGFFGEEDVIAPATNEKGEYIASERSLFYGEADTRDKSLIAWTPDRSRVGLARLNRSHLGGVIDITLAPACRVILKSKSSSLEKLGQPLNWANCYLYWNDLRPFGCASTKGMHEFLLPPGEYKLNVYSSDTYSVNIPVKIQPGDTEKTFEADLPANRLSHLIGKPAPELIKIKGWKNGGPLKLADLEGKVVILDFWGYWCGPCVHSMPELMDLHEKYKDKGLVIIAVHDDSADSIEDMDHKLETARREIWNGKDLPFLVALDGGGPTPVEGRDGVTARGATTAAYGINSFPTQILIDRDGHVVGRLRKGQLETLLAELDKPD